MGNTETATPEGSQEIEVAIRLRVPADWSHDEIASKLAPVLAPFRGEVIDCGPLSFRAVAPAAGAEPESSGSGTPSTEAADPSARLSWPPLPKPPKPPVIEIGSGGGWFPGGPPGTIYDKKTC